MTRNLKAFGLVLVAAMALGAIGVQGASAHDFTSSSANTVLTGSIDPSTGKHIFTTTAGLTFECSTGTFEGLNAGTVRDTVTVHPQYSSCTSSLGGNMTVHTGGCNFVVDSDTTQDASHSASSEHATVSIECESSHVIEITASGCNIAFSSKDNSVNVNQSLHGVRFTSLVSHSGKNAGTLNATLKTMHYTATAGSLCGLAGHPAGTYMNGTYNGKFTVTGYAFSTTVSGSTTNGTVWSHGAQVDIDVD